MKQIRLYNVLFPMWLLLLVPQVWLIVLPGNLLIDCTVVLLTLTALNHTQKRTVLKQIWWKVWLLGFAADFVGAATLLPVLPLMGCVSEEVRALIHPLMYNCWLSPIAVLWTAAAVAVAGVCIYLFDRWVLRFCAPLSTRERHILALTLAVVTAPWTFFIPAY